MSHETADKRQTILKSPSHRNGLMRKVELMQIGSTSTSQILLPFCPAIPILDFANQRSFMRIRFNNYKGFLYDDNVADRHVDFTDSLTPISGNADSSKKGKQRRSLIEYRTDGFDVLGLAWGGEEDTMVELAEDETDENLARVLEYGRKLRTLCHKTSSSNTSTRNDDLSSHTTIYGDSILQLDSEKEIEEVEQEVCSTEAETPPKLKRKQQKLTPDERKELRRQTREQKLAAKAMKSQKKAKSKITAEKSEMTLTADPSLSTSRQKIKHLKGLATQCLASAQRQLDPTGKKKLNDNSRIAQVDDVSVYVSDIRNLLDDEWLSDSNIGWVYAFLYHGYIFPLLSQRLKHSKFQQYDEDSKKEIFVSPICLLLPTFTFLIANHPIPEELLPVLPKGINDAQIVFCPLNDNDDFAASEGGSHWSLVVFAKLPSEGQKEYIQKALVYDSMFQANANETDRLVENMAKILHNPKDNKSTLNWDTVHVRDTPQQTNGSDCGVFVAAVTSVLVSKLVALANTNYHDAFIDLSVSRLRFSATDSRIWMLSTLLNFLENAFDNV
jgi:sentrin-specific protease 8